MQALRSNSAFGQFNFGLTQDIWQGKEVKVLAENVNSVNSEYHKDFLCSLVSFLKYA